MRSCHQAISCVLFWLSSSHLLLGNLPSSRIILGDSDWGKASQEEVVRVLQSTFDQLLDKDNLLYGATIVVLSTDSSPVCIDRNDEAKSYYIKISAQDRHWCQYIFQFAHELGHLLCGARMGTGKQQWFEESLCEAIALHTLEKMSEKWQKVPPYPIWKEYAPAFQKYRVNRIRKQAYPENFQLGSWWRKNSKTLESYPCMRRENLWVAMKILPVIDRNPSTAWSACSRLNHEIKSGEQSFSEFLQKWRAECQTQEQIRFVEEIASEFNLPIMKNS